MAIDARCPFCDKAYRLKDDLVGKKVTCANSACRKTFTVAAAPKPPTGTAPALPPGTKPAPAVPPPAPTAAELDALAAASFSDEPEKAPEAEDTRTVPMACTMCDHKWTVPFALVGRNVLCPECKARQKVPEPLAAKKIDWRDGSGRPSLAKVEQLEGVVASTDKKMLSAEAMREAGMLDPELESRPTSFYVKIGSAVALLLAGLVAGGIYWNRTRTETKQEAIVELVLKGAESDEIKALPPAVSPLFKAALLVAAGEHDARIPDTQHTESAARHLNEARAELERAPKSGDRDALLGELAVVTVLLGGDEKQVKERLKISFTPQAAPPGARASIKPSPVFTEGVQGQLRRTFEALKSDRVAAEFDLRASVVRRVARELVKHDQTRMLVDTLQAGFTEAEIPEVKAQIGLELLRAGKNDEARELAEELKSTIAAANPVPNPLPASAQAIWLAVTPPVPDPPTVASPPSAGEPSDGTRWAYAALGILRGKPDDALAIANRPGRAEGRLKALALAAEWAEQPGPFLDAAEVVVKVESGRKEAPPLPGFVLLRLARAAGRASATEKATTFAKAIPKDDLREFARADALRERLKANPGQPVNEDDDAPLPPESAKYLLGHAWARLAVARHAAFRGNDRGLAAKYGRTWPTGTVAPFGQAGVMLGLQDYQQK